MTKQTTIVVTGSLRAKEILAFVTLYTMTQFQTVNPKKGSALKGKNLIARRIKFLFFLNSWSFQVVEWLALPTWTLRSLVQIPLETEFISWLYGVFLHRAIHYKHSIISIWLKWCWKDHKRPNNLHHLFRVGPFRRHLAWNVKAWGKWEKYFKMTSAEIFTQHALLERLTFSQLYTQLAFFINL